MSKKHKSWKDVTIAEYFSLVDKLSDESLNEYDKVVAKLAFAEGCDEQDIWNLSINEFTNKQVEALWIDNFDFSTDVKFKSISICGDKYLVDTNLQNFTVAQYIDFQTFWPKRKENWKIYGNILACFLIPEGKKYADGYDISEIVDTINNNLDIVTANELMFFFLKQSLISTRATVNYFNFLMKRMTKKLGKKKMEKLEKTWEQTKKDILDGFRSLTQ